MPIRSWVVSLCVVLVCAGAGCSIENCERGATCSHDDDEGEYESERECVGYCGRLSVCGAPQARDFDQCVSSCEDRFSALPEQTAKLCACAEQSTCSDVIEGRCTESPPPRGTPGGSSGGSTGSGGTPPSAGATSCPGSGTCPAGGSANNAGAGASGTPNAGAGGSTDPGAAGACD